MNMQGSRMWLQGRPVAAIVMGGSAGALQVMRHVLAAVSPALAIPIVLVLHLPARATAGLRDVLQFGVSLPVRAIEDKESIEAGAVYFAPPDYHLFIERAGYFALSVDAAVHFSRPSIDVTFESAADAYGSELLGVLLSGASEDGAAGLHSIHRSRGITIVQDPESAESMIMPKSALSLFAPDYILTPAQIAALLQSLHLPEGSLSS